MPFAQKALAALSWSTGLTAAILIALAIAIFFLWYAFQERRELRLMKSVKMSRAADVAALAPGTLVEVQGTLRCATPLRAEFSGKPSAYFRAETIKSETWYESDSDGKKQQKNSETKLHSNVQFAPCEVEDDSGRVALDLTGAAIDEAEVLRELVDGEVKALSGLVGAVVGIGRDNTTVTRVEHNLGFDIPIYVLGEVQPGGRIGAPAKGSATKAFIVSLKSEEERSRHVAEMSQFGMQVGSVSLAISILLFCFAWYKAS